MKTIYIVGGFTDFLEVTTTSNRQEKLKKMAGTEGKNGQRALETVQTIDPSTSLPASELQSFPGWAGAEKAKGGPSSLTDTKSFSTNAVQTVEWSHLSLPAPSHVVIACETELKP